MANHHPKNPCVSGWLPSLQVKAWPCRLNNLVGYSKGFPGCPHVIVAHALSRSTHKQNFSLGKCGDMITSVRFDVEQNQLVSVAVRVG